MQTVLITILQGLLRESEPVLGPTVAVASLDGANKDRVARATEAFYAAVRAVCQSDHAAALRDWNERQATFGGWIKQLTGPDQQQRSGLDTPGLSAEGVFGEIRILTLWQTRRSEESARKARTIAQCCTAVEGIVTASATKLQAATVSAQGQLAALPTEIDGTTRAQATQADLRLIRESAVERINALTRQVLDLDENTVPVTVNQWWTRCGIDEPW